MGEVCLDRSPSRWAVVAWESSHGRHPVGDWLDRLKQARPSEHADILRCLALIERDGPDSRPSHLDQLGGGLRAILAGGSHLIYFTAPDRSVVLLSGAGGGVEVGSGEIELAAARMLEWMRIRGLGDLGRDRQS